MTAEFQRTLKNDVTELELLIADVVAFLVPFELSAKAEYAVNLAVEELLLNVIKYAYDTPGVHDIEFRMSVDDQSVTMHIEDDGKPFDPLAKETPDITLPLEDRPIGGLGLHLVRKIFDKMDYRRDAQKNILDLSIRRQAA